MKRKRRTFSKDFKITVIKEIENEAKQAEVCQKYDLHPVLVNQWRKIYNKYPDTAFRGKGKSLQGGRTNCRVRATSWQALC